MKNQLLRGSAVRTVLASLLLLSLLPAAAQAGWKEDYESERRRNAVEALEQDGRFTLLLAAVEAAGLTETLATANVNLFAPTDEAFLALGEDTIQALLDDVPTLTDILLYHLVEGRRPLFRLARESSVPTLQGSEVLVVRERHSYSVDGVPIVERNLGSSNALIRVIEEVLQPPAPDEEIESIVDVLERDGRFTILLAALDAAGLLETLDTGGPFTLFAPTDEAFAALGEDTIQALLDDIPALTNILLYHVLPEPKRALELLFEGTTPTVQGASVEVRLESWRYLFVDDAPVTSNNVSAPNGVIHVLAAVLIPPPADQTVLDVLTEEGFTTLVAAIEAAGLAEALGDLGPVTIFAPTNEAFAELGEETLGALLNDVPTLQQILLYHVVRGEKTLLEVIFERRLETIEGSDVVSRWFFGPVFINRERVVEPNISAPEAIVHGIDGVLIPPGL